MSLLAHDNLYSLPDMSSPAHESYYLVVGILDMLLLLSIALVLRTVQRLCQFIVQVSG